ncbi:putative membrane protein, partial [Yersinia pestis PY-34]
MLLSYILFVFLINCVIKIF